MALFIADADVFTNGAKKMLAKRTPTFINRLANLLNKAPINPPD